MLHRLRGRFRFLPLKFPKNPITPIKTSRDTLHLGTGVTSRTKALRGASGGEERKKRRISMDEYVAFYMEWIVEQSMKRKAQEPQVPAGVWGKAPPFRSFFYGRFSFLVRIVCVTSQRTASMAASTAEAPMSEP